jgi:cytoskeletal protein CcmA (bactofilin family)
VIWRRKNEHPDPATDAPSAPEWTLETAEPAPALLHPSQALRSSLAADASISGRLSFTAPTRIDGTLRGEVRASDMLVVGETGLVDGTIYAAKLIVLGQVRGEVLGAERVEIGPRGAFEGVIEAHSLVVEEGGVLDGDCRITPPSRASVHVLFPKPDEQASGSGAS